MKVNTEGRIKNLNSMSVHAVSQFSTFGTFPKNCDSYPDIQSLYSPITFH